MLSRIVLEMFVRFVAMNNVFIWEASANNQFGEICSRNISVWLILQGKIICRFVNKLDILLSFPLMIQYGIGCFVICNAVLQLTILETQCSDLSYGNKVIAPDGTEWTGGAVGDTPAGRRAQQNILRELPGPSGLGRQGIDEDKLSSPWLLIIDDRILKHIKKCTEQEPRRCQEVDDWSVSLQELKVFIAILYARGQLEPLEDVRRSMIGLYLFKN
ncbi:hypothetical protein QE152_g8730 [Popillia japonica]|uniref:Uncharacterized protein n=1 Tax=Popillia japonica TaxID=7064 RepID=A0AAW1M5I7_POPJA